MPWERRRGRGRYYTTTTRCGGRRVRCYYGTGPVGELAATLDAIRRAEHEEAARRECSERERFEAAEEPLRRLCRAADLALRAALVADGLRRHGGEWRRPRHGRSEQRERTRPGRRRRAAGAAAARRAG